jgi:hypothetical protein
MKSRDAAIVGNACRSARVASSSNRGDEKRIGADQKRSGSQLTQGREGRFDFAFVGSTLDRHSSFIDLTRRPE